MERISNKVMNLAQFLQQSAINFGSAPGFVWGEIEWTWSQLNARANAMAHALSTVYGVKKGDRIIVQSPNCNQMFESAFACWRIGAVWVPANFRGAPDDLAWSAQSSGAVGMICHSDFPEHAKHCAPDLKFTISIGVSDFGRDYDEIVSEHEGQTTPVVSVDYDDPCWFFYTSGTTGKPKAAVLTHGQMAFVINNHLADLMPGTTESDASIAVAPLSHGAGIHALIQVARSVPTIIPASERFNAQEIWQLIQEWRVANMFTVPTILKMLVEDNTVDQYDHSSLRQVIYAGAPMYRADQIYALEKLGPVLVQYFGLGEVTGAITVLRPDQHGNGSDAPMREGTCGQVRTGMQIQIQDKDGNEVIIGETGEFCLIGPAVFAGYWDNPEANAKAFRDGWFRTGDIGHMDKDGFFYLTGRESDMYISGGSNIYPREIEEKLLMHPAITETAIFGIPDPKWGEVGVAICVVNQNDKIDAEVLKEWLSPRVAKYKMPQTIEFWPSIPKSGYGKITKKLVRAEYERRCCETKGS